MKIARFAHRGDAGIGIVEDDQIVDLRALPGTSEGIPALLAGGAERRAALQDTARRAPRLAPPHLTPPAPLPPPPQVLALGLNYPDHLQQSNIQAPGVPVFFNRQTTCVIGPGAAIHRPRVSTLLDYEGELGIVIGRRCRHVPLVRALEVVAGYLVVNDVTVRDWQLRSPTMT